MNISTDNVNTQMHFTFGHGGKNCNKRFGPFVTCSLVHPEINIKHSGVIFDHIHFSSHFVFSNSF